MYDTIPNINREKLLSRFGYNAETGEIINLATGKPVKMRKNSQGFLSFKYGIRSYNAQRIVWFMVHDEWPEIVAFRDKKKTNLKLDNLYKQFYAAAMKETANYRKLGTRGTMPAMKQPWQESQQWRSFIYIKGEMITIGFFDTEQEAHEAYNEFVYDRTTDDSDYITTETEGD